MKHVYHYCASDKNGNHPVDGIARLDVPVTTNLDLQALKEAILEVHNLTAWPSILVITSLTKLGEAE